MSQDGENKYNNGNMRVACCIVVQDCEGNVLLTKRAAKMRTFPDSWILPGGHIDPGETLENCVMRELWEETGIHIEKEETKSNDDDSSRALSYKGSKVTLRPFYAYESAFLAQYFDKSTPLNVDLWTLNVTSCPMSHFILYFEIKLGCKTADVDIELNPDECQAYCWLNSEDL